MLLAQSSKENSAMASSPCYECTHTHTHMKHTLNTQDMDTYTIHKHTRNKAHGIRNTHRTFTGHARYTHRTHPQDPGHITQDKDTLHPLRSLRAPSPAFQTDSSRNGRQIAISRGGARQIGVSRLPTRRGRRRDGRGSATRLPSVPVPMV